MNRPPTAPTAKLDDKIKYIVKTTPRSSLAWHSVNVQGTVQRTFVENIIL